MPVGKDSVVGVEYELFDTDGQLIERTQAPLEYLHGGYGGMFPAVEKALKQGLAGLVVFHTHPMADERVAF